jgi:hypothetical protein
LRLQVIYRLKLFFIIVRGSAGAGFIGNDDN